MSIRNLRRFLRKETGTWALVAITILVGGFSIWTSNQLYRSRGQQQSIPADAQTTSPRCTLTFNRTTPPCNRDIDIVGISIDRSSSMNALESDGRTKLVWAKEAASTFVNTLKASGTSTVKVAVNSFGAQGNDGTGVLDSTYNSTLHSALVSNFDSVLNAITNVRHIRSGTCIMCGIRLANRQVNTSDPARKVAILISDGKANHNWNGSTSNAKANAIAEANAGRAMGVSYYVIGYGNASTGGIDETTLRSIAGTSGNYQYKPNAQDWSNAFLNILNSICTGPTPTRSANTPTPTRRYTPTPTRSVTPTPGGTQISPTADTHVRSDSPSSSYGNGASLRADASPTHISYMRFDLTSLANRTINKAYLRLYVTNRTAGTLNIRRLSSTWSESTTYNNRPTLGTSIRTFNAPSTTGTWVSVELTTFVNNNKGRVINFAINTSSSDDFVFNSSEASSNKAHLLIQ